MTRRHYDWVALAERLRERPSRWVLEFPNHPTRLAKRIRLRQHPSLRFDDGHIESRILNEYKLEGVAARGDVWVRWVPTPNTRHEERS